VLPAFGLLVSEAVPSIPYISSAYEVAASLEDAYVRESIGGTVCVVREVQSSSRDCSG
jgi:hypothetical protein